MAQPDIFTPRLDRLNRSKVANFETGAGTTAFIAAPYDVSLYDPSMSLQNFGYFDMTSLTASTTTSQTIKLVRVVPVADMTVAKIVTIAGAAAA